jgi:O-antigen/teichoic acid export membrane protein
MAAMDDAAALELTAAMARVATLLGTALAVILALAASTLIPALMGSAYRDALWPTVVLLFANVLWGVQWLLSRALAARGDPGLLVRCFSANLGTMAAADLVLIPIAGATGAAIGACVGAIVGLAVCLRAYRGRGVAATSLVPRGDDLRRVRDVAGQAARALRRGGVDGLGGDG